MKIFDRTNADDPRVLVVFTDGDDNYSKKKIGEVIQKAKRENINIFCVGFWISKRCKSKRIASKIQAENIIIYIPNKK